jgi:hypothetical protein
MGKIQSIEKDGGKVNFGFDTSGRIIIVKPIAPSRLLTQG